MSNLIMCEDCLTVFDSTSVGKLNSCPIHGCYGELFEIDELMIDIVTNLRNKGYDTKYCCSGHWNYNNPCMCKASRDNDEIENSMDKLLIPPYVMIAGKYAYDLLNELVDKGDKILNRKCFNYEFQDDHCQYGKVVVIRGKFKYIKETQAATYRELFNSIAEFVELSEALPELVIKEKEIELNEDILNEDTIYDIEN